MSNRLGLTPPQDLSESQKRPHALFSEYTNQRYARSPRTSLDDGTLIGPFGILLHHPPVAESIYSLIKALQTIPGLSSYAKEVVIAVAGARAKCAYENYAHAIIAKRVGISESALSEIHAGKCPDTLTEEGKAAFALATAAGDPGVVDQSVWARTVKVLGKDGAAAVVHYTGFYAYVSTILNGFDAKVPEDAT
ncbi:AhpD-like protein [Exophiala viscosa]|uniref:AhpD-like protein n=1 Tax=Exophiala viscosa TaxID=2486360 RepID=A0AAN6II46_9EURO|nr:AhpD-like protein [Exophiala viscosa]KAI1627080.1 AhpD-like protein [Exophiala viscosa]